MPTPKIRRLLALEIFDAAIKAVQPATLLAEAIINEPNLLSICGKKFKKSDLKNIYVIGAGKASAAMAVAVEEILGNLLTDGLVITKYDHGLPTNKIKIIEAGHPIPDEQSVLAVSKTIQLLQNVSKHDLVICLISGGASSLWCDTPDGISLSDLQLTAAALIKSGASIDEINTVRKQLSDFKGGKLPRYCKGAEIISLIISDVVSNNLSIIASGPTLPDLSTAADALTIIENYKLYSSIPLNIIKELNKRSFQQPISHQLSSPSSQKVHNNIIGTNEMALNAARIKAESLGINCIVIAAPITGEVSQEAKKLTALAIAYDGKKPAMIIQGGETTLKVTGSGEGGRNQHFALTSLAELKNEISRKKSSEITILSGGTDGTDGPTAATGGIVDEDTLRMALEKGLSIPAYLENHDSHAFLKETDSLIITGPTQTNVMDIMFALIY